jgi:hypothetical protein
MANIMPLNGQRIQRRLSEKEHRSRVNMQGSQQVWAQSYKYPISNRPKLPFLYFSFMPPSRESFQAP